MQISAERRERMVRWTHLAPGGDALPCAASHDWLANEPVINDACRTGSCGSKGGPVAASPSSPPPSVARTRADAHR